jgi:hypothetical protein
MQGDLQEYQNPVKSLDVNRRVKLITIEAQRSAEFKVVSPVLWSVNSIAGKDSISGMFRKSRTGESSTAVSNTEGFVGISSRSKINGGLEDRAIGRSRAR